jgi:hypothetical protein
MMTVVYWISIVLCVKLNEKLRDLKLLTKCGLRLGAENGSLLMPVLYLQCFIVKPWYNHNRPFHFAIADPSVIGIFCE